MSPLPHAAHRFLPMLLVLHGIAHFAGAGAFVALFAEHRPARLLAGLLTSGDPAVLATLALLYAVLGTAFLMVAVLVGTAARLARRALLVVATASLALCTATLFASEVGFAINVGLMAIAWSGTEDPDIPGPPTAAGPAKPPYVQLTTPRNRREL